MGKGGFDVSVGAHTRLDGAVIGSTAAADKNRLETGTLGFSDIENRADYKVEHQSAGISTGGSIAGQFAGNMANGLLVGANHSGSDSSTTKAAVSEGAIVIRDQASQAQDVSGLSRDVEHANQTLSPIFDKEKEQNRLQEAQLIGEIGNQAADIARTEGQIRATNAGKAELASHDIKEPAKGASKEEWERYNEKLTATDSYKAAQQQWGTGSAIQQGIQAATAALQGPAAGYQSQASSWSAAPYLAEVIHDMTTTKDANGHDVVNVQANLMAHAVVGAVTAYAAGNSAVAGASGAAMGEYIAQQMYPGVKREDLTEDQRQTISTLGTLAAALAGGVTGDSTAGAVAGAQAGKNAVENNWLHVNEKTELEVAKQKLKSNDPAEREKAQQKINDLLEKSISRDQKVIDACGNGKAASAGCAAARLEAYSAKSEYETGNYNNKVSDMYPDAYGQIVNLLNITSVDAQNQQQVKDALTQYAMDVLGVDRQTAQSYAETKQGMDIIVASVTPVLGSAAAKQLSKIVDANLKVVAKGYVDGVKFSDTNQSARPSQLADFNKPTLINDVVQARIDKRPDKNLPNGNMGTAHAEVGVIQQAYEKGMTKGKDMLMSVSGEKVCSYCMSDIKIMAEKSGLKSLTLFEETTGRTLYWQAGTKGFRVKGANDE
nr:VENN motif pre-toxin domain-containing protein [Pantoea sp. ACRSB]